MKESINNAFLFNLVLIFFAIMLAILIGSLSYSKAYRVKNRLIGILEKHKVYDYNAKQEIESNLKDIGYKSNPRGGSKCPARSGTLLQPHTTNYRYCIYENDEAKGYSYTVVVFMYFEIPIIGGFLEFPVSGDTKVIYDL